MSSRGEDTSKLLRNILTQLQVLQDYVRGIENSSASYAVRLDNVETALGTSQPLTGIRKDISDVNDLVTMTNTNVANLTTTITNDYATLVALGTTNTNVTNLTTTVTNDYATLVALDTTNTNVTNVDNKANDIDTIIQRITPRVNVKITWPPQLGYFAVLTSPSFYTHSGTPSFEGGWFDSYNNVFNAGEVPPSIVNNDYFVSIEMEVEVGEHNSTVRYEPRILGTTDGWIDRSNLQPPLHEHDVGATPSYKTATTKRVVDRFNLAVSNTYDSLSIPLNSLSHYTFRASTPEPDYGNLELRIISACIFIRSA